MIKPIADYITVEKPPEEELNKTKSGLYVANMQRKDFEVGKVLEVGTEVKEIKKGDNVIYLRMGTTEFEGVLIMKTDNVVALKK